MLLKILSYCNLLSGFCSARFHSSTVCEGTGPTGGLIEKGSTNWARWMNDLVLSISMMNLPPRGLLLCHLQ